jgi:hypothetical protein
MKKQGAVFLIGAFLLMTIPFPRAAEAAPRGSGALAGHIYREDMRTPVRNAVVKLRNIVTQKEYASEPTDPEGLYRIPEIEEGRYIMGVLGPGGNYNFHYSILIKSEALAKLSVAMKPGNAPVMLEQGSGNYEKKATIVDFFKSPAGILTLVATAEMTVFLFALKEDEASPVIID